VEKGKFQVSFDVLFHGKSLGRVTVECREHNVLNALAAIAVTRVGCSWRDPEAFRTWEVWQDVSR